MQDRATSLGDAFLRVTQRFPDRVAMWLPPEKGGGDPTPLTFRELRERVRGYAGTLKARGLERGDRLALYAENAPEWTMVDLAAQTLGVVVVTLFSTLPRDQAEYILQDSGAKLTLCGPDGQARLPDYPTELLKDFPQEPMPEAEWEAEARKATREDLATLIYTSGTTGVPKGVMLPHRAILHLPEVVPGEIHLTEDDVFYCFLPISHVYERTCGQYLPLLIGASVGYARNLAAIAADLPKVRPTVILCVPRFLESFRSRVTEAVEKAPPLRQRLFRLALAQGVARAQGRPAPLAALLDKIVMAKVRERTGGRLRYFVSGGAALAPAVAEFYMAFGLTVLQGYGLTETAGGTVVNRPERNKYWTVGEPLDMEVKLESDGEILIRGGEIMLGYWNKPEDTAAVLDADGWFRTGDIGAWDGANLKITDRKKDLLVLGNGKNVAPQPIENRLKESDLIQEAVVLGDGMDHCVALVVPEHARVRARLGLPEDAPLGDNPDAHKLVKADVDRTNKTLAPFESVKRFALLDEPFTVENGELTPSLKVKRKVVRERYADVVARLS